MSRRFCRQLSSTKASSATRAVVDRLNEGLHSAQPIVRKQLIDAYQLQRLSLALNRPNLYKGICVKGELNGPPDGTPVPPGYHMAYFTPALMPDELGPDGADVTYNPPAPFTRRMWAGGYITWEKENPMRVGQKATESTRLVSAEAKRTRGGTDMIVIGVEKSFYNDSGLCLIDRRDWVFRHAFDPSAISEQHNRPEINQESPLPAPEDSTQHVRDFLQTPISLFRFSALTFNAHMIHYSLPWVNQVEGHPQIVVHGPLNLIHILDFWRDEAGSDGTKIPTSIRYKATAPFYAGIKYRALLEFGANSTFIRLCDLGSDEQVRTGMVADVSH